MEDVIFAGTRDRKPTGMAEVSLTLIDPRHTQALTLAHHGNRNSEDMPSAAERNIAERLDEASIRARAAGEPSAPWRRSAGRTEEVEFREPSRTLAVPFLTTNQFRASDPFRHGPRFTTSAEPTARTLYLRSVDASLTSTSSARAKSSSHDGCSVGDSEYL